MSEFNPDDYKIKKDEDINTDVNKEEKKESVSKDFEIEGGRYERDESEYESLNRILYGKKFESNTESTKTSQKDDSQQQNNSEEFIRFSKSTEDNYQPQNRVSMYESQTNMSKVQNEYTSMNSFGNDENSNNHYSETHSIEGSDAFLTRRVVAHVLDSVIITVTRILLTFVFALLNFTGQVQLYDQNNLIKTMFVYIIFLAFVLYLPTFLFLVLKPHLNGGLTFGRKLAGIRIVGIDGRKPSLIQLTIREFFCITIIVNNIVTIIFLIGLGFLYKSKPRQTLHDVITKTKLVNMD